MSQSAVTNRRTRTGLLIGGGLLWILVFAGLWMMNRSLPESAGTASGTAAESDSPQGIPSDSREQTSPWDPEGIDDFELTERSGRTVTKQDLLGRPWAVSFIFTRCPTSCPKICNQMRKLQDELAGTDVRLVSISVDPEFDTPEVLRQFAQTYGADPDRWLFLTGDRKEIYSLIIDSFKMPVGEHPDGDQVLHSNSILHVNAQGRVVEKYNALKDPEMAELRRALMEEARSLESDDEEKTTAAAEGR